MDNPCRYWKLGRSSGGITQLSLWGLWDSVMRSHETNRAEAELWTICPTATESQVEALCSFGTTAKNTYTQHVQTRIYPTYSTVLR